MSGDRVGIIGIGQSEFCSRRDDASYPELVREGVVRAMQDAKLDFDAIEAVVFSLSPDAMIGIGNAERLGVDAVGGRNKPFLRINNGGATGISAVAAAYLPRRLRHVRCRAHRRRRQDRRMRRFADNPEQDLGSELRTPAAARHHQHAGHVSRTLHAALRHDRGGHGARHGEEPPACGTQSEGASAADRLDRRCVGVAADFLADQADGLLSAVIGRRRDGAGLGDVHPRQSSRCGVDHRRRPLAETYWMGDRMGNDPMPSMRTPMRWAVRSRSRIAWRVSRTRLNRCKSRNCMRRSATPNSTPSTRRVWCRVSGESVARCGTGNSILAARFR